MGIYIRPELRIPASVGVLSFVTGVGVGYAVREVIGRRRALKQVFEPISVYENGDSYDEHVHLVLPTVDQLAVDPRSIFPNVELVRDPEHGHVDVNKTVAPIINDFAKATKIAIDNGYRDMRDPEHGHVDVNKTVAPIINDFGGPIKIAIDNGYRDMRDPEEEAVEELEVDDYWNQEEEESERSPDSPYTIHRREFADNTTGYLQMSLTYYAADQIMCDENDIPIHHHEKLVGRLEFGRGSGDTDLVFVRNDKMKSEYEIIRNVGSYQVVILGLMAEEQADETDLRHSREIRRFRLE
jgi:hypothetical protein